VRRSEYKSTSIEASIPSLVYLERQRHYSRKSIGTLRNVRHLLGFFEGSECQGKEVSERIEMGCSEQELSCPIAAAEPQHTTLHL
jgi:hypothetical protein